MSVRTVGRWLERLGISQPGHLDPNRELNKKPGTITARFPGHMLHLDVKKVGRIPDDGGWRAHGRGSDKARSAKRGPGARIGYTFLHSAIDGYSRLAYTEPLEGEKASTTIGFFYRARAFFAAHGIERLIRVVSDNGSNYRAADFVALVTSMASRHQRTRHYTPRHNGKVERYNRLLKDEVLYTRVNPSEQVRRDAVAVRVHHYNYHRPHTACRDEPPATRVHARVDLIHLVATAPI